jgi:putative oxidoreductase
MTGKDSLRAATKPKGFMVSLSKIELLVSWICRVTAAAILLQTLFFKFTGAPESIYIFSKVHMEPWGRYGTGVVELIAAVLLLSSCYCWLGALLSLGVISGAIASHFIVLGIEVQGDHGLLFILASVVFATNAVTLVLHRRQVPFLRDRSKFQKV